MSLGRQSIRSQTRCQVLETNAAEAKDSAGSRPRILTTRSSWSAEKPAVPGSESILGLHTGELAIDEGDRGLPMEMVRQSEQKVERG